MTEALSEKKAVDLKDEPSLGVTSIPQEGPETYESCERKSLSDQYSKYHEKTMEKLEGMEIFLHGECKMHSLN
ncbi:hypothetical protein PCANC_11223 [Puccinia coronata f. sp. avenae]|uniref:Uncharacterized protein n=1 Tax=Puccinia coronata f. sp. avenae TaxID=200324 RepID=A0A2N5V8M7_9BASI|nr:hypothetical protein PCANC_10197 [Puccinia coronata f. sp. avenae]PLW46344.1 hypothetical protein PCANC_11223 [Puccinia coronata f. sp. avenae]